MKVVLLCMAFAAVSVAMPVAEKTPEVTPALVSVPEPAVKNFDAKPSDDITAAVPEEKKADEIADKPSEAAKPIVADPVKKEKAADPAPEVKKDDTEKAAEPEKKIDASATVEAKSDAPASSDKPKTDEVQATVKEVPESVAARTAEPADIKDVVVASIAPAIEADDVVDPAAIIPLPEKKDEPAVKSAEPSAEAKKDTPAAVTADVPKSDDKEAEPKAAVKPPVESAIVPADAEAKPIDDSLRVVRDTVEDKAVEPAEKITESAARNVPVKEIATKKVVEEPATPVAAEPKAAIEPESSVAEEKPEEETVKALEPAVNESKDAINDAPIPTVTEPAIKKGLEAEKPLADAPASSSSESDESAQTSEESSESQANSGSKV